MKEILLLHYPPCGTCRKALAYLKNKGISFTARNIKEENPSYAELQKWIPASGLPFRKFFNTSGQVYRDLNLKEKLPTMTEEEALQLLSGDGMLVKRPLLITEHGVLAGFREEAWEALLNAADTQK